VECRLYFTEIAGAPAYLLSPPSVKGRALVLHGYGSNKEEMFGCALAVARVGFKVYVCDLPGHGEHKERLTWPAVREFIEKLKGFGFKAAVGHSLGARLVCLLSCPKLVLLSPPLEAKFEGTKKDLLRTLRARRVREEGYYEGLTSVLNSLPALDFNPTKKILLLYSKNDLPTVKKAAAKAKEKGIKVEVIAGVGHNDIVSAQTTLKKIEEWLSLLFG